MHRLCTPPPPSPHRSLDATSTRMLSNVSDLLGETAISSRDLEVVSKTHDDRYLRPANKETEERSCASADRCICKWIAVFRHGEESDNAFVCREYLLPSQEKAFLDNGDLPRTPQKCLLCSRYFTSYIYTLAKNSPSFCPNSAIQLQAFANKITVDSPVDTALDHTSSVGSDDGYSLNSMLLIDERWVDSSSSRSELSTLLWKPVVRFNCSDYRFVKSTDGTPRVVQFGIETPQQRFVSPPS